MKILTIRQPWAHLIVNGTKDIENRDWLTKYRGAFLVHAAQRIDLDGCERHRISPDKLQTGGVIGMAEIVDCVDRHPSKWFDGKYGFVLCANGSASHSRRGRGLWGSANAPPRLLRKLGLDSIAMAGGRRPKSAPCHRLRTSSGAALLCGAGNARP